MTLAESWWKVLKWHDTRRVRKENKICWLVTRKKKFFQVSFVTITEYENFVIFIVWNMKQSIRNTHEVSHSLPLATLLHCSTSNRVSMVTIRKKSCFWQIKRWEKYKISNYSRASSSSLNVFFFTSCAFRSIRNEE